jgi:hypothetical protein
MTGFPLMFPGTSTAFSREVDTGSGEENAACLLDPAERQARSGDLELNWLRLANLPDERGQGSGSSLTQA